MQPENWSVPRAIEVFREAASYWDGWNGQLKIDVGGARDAAFRRSGFAVQLMSHVERNSAVATLTTSLPERLGGDRNYDYRYAWVRDASLSLDLLSSLGRAGEVKRYLNWLCGLKSETAAPLQVCYRLDGDTKLEQEMIPYVLGYENSRPVVRGCRAAKQKQLGATGFFADCTRTYLDHGGEWRDEFWQLLKRCADHTAKNWQGKDAGIWELPEEAHYVTSRVMCWVALDRAIHIAAKTEHPGKTDHWREAADAIHAEVMTKGWCEDKKSFRQQYDSDALDASALIIPLLGFLLIDHPRVVGTIAAIEREVVKGLVHRFDPTASLGGEQLPIGEFEGAFLPCVFWHVQVLAKAGRCNAKVNIAPSESWQLYSTAYANGYVIAVASGKFIVALSSTFTGLNFIVTIRNYPHLCRRTTGLADSPFSPHIFGLLLPAGAVLILTLSPSHKLKRESMKPSIP